MTRPSFASISACREPMPRMADRGVGSGVAAGMTEGMNLARFRLREMKFRDEQGGSQVKLGNEGTKSASGAPPLGTAAATTEFRG